MNRKVEVHKVEDGLIWYRDIYLYTKGIIDDEDHLKFEYLSRKDPRLFPPTSVPLLYEFSLFSARTHLCYKSR